MIDYFVGEFEFLSNYCLLDIPIVIDGLVFDNAEAAYQAMKSLDEEVKSRFQEFSPYEAKKVGKTIQVRENWEDIKVSIMKTVVRKKFIANPHLGYKLKDTHPEMLIDSNRDNDRFWGVDIPNHVGENQLGKILMQIRSELRAQE